jgi:SAM-dependent MidA family methyltransferase
MIKFSTYFHNWLYSDDGYYANYKIIGKQGDFFTAVSASKFFGGSVAKRLIETIEDGFLPHNTTIVEIGAHHGYLLADIVQFIYTLKPALLKTLNFAIVEKYEKLKEKQKQYFKNSFDDVINLQHYSCIEDVKSDDAFIVANEIFDAFSCELVYTKDDKLLQAFVEDNKIVFKQTQDKDLLEISKNHDITKGEIPLGFDKFAQTLFLNIKKFEFVTFDYGDKYPRNDFSCRVYQKHKVYPIFDENINLKELFKKTDITYDVNFAYLIDCFEKHNIQNIIYETQLKALVRFGIIELLEILHKNADEKTYIKETNRIKTLLEPTGMGDRFKMALFRKECIL